MTHEQIVVVAELAVLALLLAPVALFGIFIMFALLVRWYSDAIGDDRKLKKGHHLPTRVRWINWLYASLGSYYWLPCARCGRMYGGHESGGQQGSHSTCDRCPGSIGWFPYGSSTSRYYDGKQWADDPVPGAYFDLNAAKRPPP